MIVTSISIGRAANWARGVIIDEVALTAIMFATSRQLAAVVSQLGRGIHMTDMNDAEFEIRRVVENWAIWRDAGDFEKLRSTWHDQGQMVTTWTEGSADKFVAMAKEAFERGLTVNHLVAGSSVEVEGDRAVCQTKMIICQRARIDDVDCDVECIGRFYDLMERRAGRWGIVRRQPIYEQDRIVPIDGGQVSLDAERLSRFPVGYRHLAYVQSLQGIDVRTNLPGRRGAEVEALYEMGRRWLAGGPIAATDGKSQPE
jgi:hypothetical protein